MLAVTLALVAGACGSGESDNRVAAVARPTSTLAATTTTTTTTTPPRQVSAAAPPTVRRVRVLPAADAPTPAAPKKAKAATYRGPQPTGRIVIPRIGLNHVTYEGIELSTLDHGPSHWPGTAMPGQVGNTVFPGHRVTHSRPFYDIDKIQVGDQVTFLNDTGRYTYEVTEYFVVDDSETWIANPTDTPTMTIFGCHPKHSAQQRYVVKGKLVQSEKAIPRNEGNSPTGDGNQYAPPSVGPNEPPAETTTTTQKRGLLQLGK